MGHSVFIRLLKTIYVFYFVFMLLKALFGKSGFFDTYNYSSENTTLSTIHIIWDSFEQFFGCMVVYAVPFIFVAIVFSYIFYGTLNPFFMFKKS